MCSFGIENKIEMAYDLKEQITEQGNIPRVSIDIINRL
jgi:hypothetical protein